ncbi:MAG: sugar phosphate isomerase/epimerase [Deltaproteobacteria bacterium]|nr:sugar phosphate isomerase/epimerase [Deltaproteobacteria bacterium]
MLYGAMNFPVKPVLKEVEAIAALGFDYVELTMDPPQAHHSAIRKQRRDLVNALEGHGMKLVVHLPSFLGLGDLTGSIRDASVNEMVSSLEVAAELDPLKVVIHPPYVTGLGVYVGDQVAEFGHRSLATVAETAERLGLTLCIENMFPRTRSLVEPDDFDEVFLRLPSLKLTLDTGHANIGGKGPKRALDFIRRFPERIAHIHASDNFGNDDNHLPIGAGAADFPKIIAGLKQIAYDDTITLEVFSRDTDYLRISREKFVALIQVD